MKRFLNHRSIQYLCIYVTAFLSKGQFHNRSSFPSWVSSATFFLDNNENDDNDPIKESINTCASSSEEIKSIGKNDIEYEKNESRNENIDIKEFDLNLETLEDDNIKINKPSSTQINEYKQALAKAKMAQKKALELHLDWEN